MNPHNALSGLGAHAADLALTIAAIMDPFLEAPTAQWHLRLPSGGQFGPSSADTMRQWLHEGRITPDALVWRDGWADWKAAGAVFPGLAQRAAMAAAPAMQPAGHAAGYAAGYGAGGYGAPAGAFPQNEPGSEFAVGESSEGGGGGGGGGGSYRRGNDQVVQASVIVFGIALVVLLPVLIYALSSQTTKEEMEGPKKKVITRQPKEGATPSATKPSKSKKSKGGDDEGGTDVDGGPAMRL
jgi:hypothetical protein